MVEFIGTESRMVINSGLWEGKQSYSAWVWDDENILEMESTVDYTKIWMY
jgi:hypothetical protein